MDLINDAAFLSRLQPATSTQQVLSGPHTPQPQEALGAGPQSPAQQHRQPQHSEQQDQPEAGTPRPQQNASSTTFAPRRRSVRDLCDRLQPRRLSSSSNATPGSTSPPLKQSGPSLSDVTQIAGPSSSRLSPSSRRRQDEAFIRAKFLKIHPPGFTFDRPLYERDMLDIMTEEEWMTAQEIWIAQAEAEEREAQARVNEQSGETQDGVSSGSPRQPDDSNDHAATSITAVPDHGSGRIPPESPRTTQTAEGDLASRSASVGTSRSPPAEVPISPDTGAKRSASELSEDSEDLPRKRLAASSDVTSLAGPSTMQTDDEWTIVEPEHLDSHRDSSSMERVAPGVMQQPDDRSFSNDPDDSDDLVPFNPTSTATPSNSRAGGIGGQAAEDEDDFVVIGAVIRTPGCRIASTRATTPTLDDDEDWREAEVS